MKLHLDTTTFRQAIQYTADRMEIPAIYIEKDYWVTWALKILFRNSIGKDIVFKGGTSLSKCFGLVNRFSEDIDLVVLGKGEKTSNQMKAKTRAIGKLVGAYLPEIELEGVTNKKGMNRKTAHSYGQAFQGAFGQVRDLIVVEATWLGYHEPSSLVNMNSFVGDMMQETGQVAMAMENELMPFEVRVLAPERTLCEKIMSLVRFSYGPLPLDDLKNKIRHTYDLHQLLKEKSFSDFIDSTDFDGMMNKVAKDDRQSFKSNSAWLDYHPSDALFFKDLLQVWPELIPTYNGDFRKLVYRDFPQDQEILDSMLRLRKRLVNLTWSSVK
ncbi:MAG: nucleotidyl transferase AbiEii/AbiGii toxin family protein [Chitinophagaceae bacterium]|nr:nucleotidyl transferase AbiEii/AbiGii toxin family protein [Chitinophagaceae bacterium]